MIEKVSGQPYEKYVLDEVFGPLGIKTPRIGKSLANEQLHQYLATLPVPVVAWLRDTQNYVQLAARGLTLWDVAPSRVERDLEQWLPLKEWISR